MNQAIVRIVTGQRFRRLAPVLAWLISCLIFASAAQAQAWWDLSWNQRKKLTFKNGAQATDLVNFPVLVVFDSTRIDYTKTQDAGEDIRFIDDDGLTELKYEIEKWDETGTSLVWVKVPQINGASSSDHVWLYYDNILATDNQDAPNVWTNGYAGVWHLKEDPTPSAGTWYDSLWAYRKRITIDNTKVTATLANFPVLISFIDAEIKAAARADGFDILFTDDDETTKLDHEIERWDDITGELIVWVKIPSLPDTVDKDIYVYYGNSSAADQQNASGVWTNNYAGVWHMDETSGTTLADSTTTSDAIKLAAAEPAASTGGRIGGAQDFDGTNDVATASDVAGLDLTNTGTIEVWISTDDVSSTESAFSGWTSKTAPPGAGQNAGNDGVDLTVVGQKIYYAALLHDQATVTFRTANSNLDGTGFTVWTSQSAPSGVDGDDTVSVAIDSDGDKLYYAAFLHDRDNESFHTASSNLDGTGFSGWTSRAAPDGADRDDRSGIDMTIVGGSIYYAAFLHNVGTEQFRTANMPLAGGALSWTNQTAPNGAGGKDTTSVGIDSDGSKLYYAAFAHNNTTEVFYTASSNLDGTGFSAWTTQTPPAGAGDAEASFIDMTLVGDRMYFSALMLINTTETFQTANAKLDGTGFSGWTVRAAPNGGGGDESAVSSVTTDGKTLYYTAFLHNGATESFYVASSTVTSHPVVFKADAYELIQTGGGFVFDWAGSPKSFGSVAASTLAHLAVAHDGTTMIYYVDGVEQRRQTVAADFLSNANVLDIGGGGTFFDGIIDEVRLSSVGRSAGWILTGYNNQSNPGVFHTVDSEMQKPASGVLADSTVNNNHGSSAGSMESLDQVAGQIDGSLDFDGGDDYVQVPDSVTWDVGSKVTVEHWFNTTVNQTDKGFVVHDSSDYKFLTYITNSSASLTFYVRTFSGVNNANWGTGTTGYFADGLWHHLVGVYDRFAGDGLRVKLYVDGLERATATGFDEDILDGDEGINIGRWQAANSFTGTLDEVQVSNIARSADWISAQHKSMSDTFVGWAPKILQWAEVEP